MIANCGVSQMQTTQENTLADRSTSGCFLVLVGPNSYFPLTAFSKKQTSVSMSSTEAEVVVAALPLDLLVYLLPASGLTSRTRGGIKAYREVCQPQKLNSMQMQKGISGFMSQVGGY